MDHTTCDATGNPGRWCDWCGEVIEGEANLHDGELVCAGCWPELRAAEERQAAEEAEAELERLEAERERAEADYERAVAELRRQERTWRRRADHARREVRRLEDLTPPVPVAPPTLPPLSGGSPFEPSNEDWADYREWAARLDREIEDIAEGGGPEAVYGYE